MARCKGCGMDLGSVYDKYCEECSKIRWITIFIALSGCLSGLFAILESSAVLWILGLALIFYAWLYNGMARNQQIEEAFSGDEDSGSQPPDSVDFGR